MNALKTLALAALMGTTLCSLPVLAQGMDHSKMAQAAKPTAAADMTEGEIRKVDKDAKKLTIKHGEIKNLDMPPMTMVFQVKDASVLETLKAATARAPAGCLVYYTSHGSPQGAVADDMGQMKLISPPELAALLDVLVEATVDYLAMQVASGAQALMLFESWAEQLAEDVFERIVIGPHTRIIEQVRAAGIDTPFIGFPRGAGAQVATYAQKVPVNCVALDTQATARLGQEIQAGGKTIQGALDNLLLRAGGAPLDARVDQLIEQWNGGPYIFNLGHGVLPDTPIEHIERTIRRVTGR